MNKLSNDEANELARNLRRMDASTAHPDFERLCIYARHWALMTGLESRGYVHTGWMDVEDLAQDVVCRVVRYWARFDPSRGKFSTWLKTVSRNEILRVGGKEARHRRLWDRHCADAA